MKRAADIIISLVIVVFLIGLTPFFYIFHRLFTKKNFIFKQIRIGKNGVPFICYKIRSIFDSDSTYIQSYGSFIRKYKIDELPQLYNVLKGDMSLVGPRPLMVEEIKHINKYNPFVLGRHRKRPGITGLSQIIVREDYVKSPEVINEKIYYDNLYCDICSIKEDTKILYHTIKYIFTQKYINSAKILPQSVPVYAEINSTMADEIVNIEMI